MLPTGSGREIRDDVSPESDLGTSLHIIRGFSTLPKIIGVNSHRLKRLEISRVTAYAFLQGPYTTSDLAVVNRLFVRPSGSPYFMGETKLFSKQYPRITSSFPTKKKIRIGK